MKPSDEISATPAPSRESTGDTRLLADRYRLGRLLGKGGMGAVFEARHVALGKPVAVKLLDRCVEVTEVLEQRFAREARAASRIHHPGVVDVIDFGVTSDGRLYYVMEMLDGVLLSELLAEVGPLPVAQAVDITVQICHAMTAAHQLQLLHRDLKPSNIMLVPHPDGRDRVKVLDFGLAKDLLPTLDDDHQTLPGTMLGTPAYMAPEQAMGLEADTRSDIYALGALVFEILTGQIPHEGETSELILQRKRLNPPRPIGELLPDLPGDLSETIMRCLSLDAQARPRTMSALADALKRHAPTRHAPTRSPTDPFTTDIVVPGRAKHTGRPKRTALWILLAAFVILGGGALALTLVLGQTDTAQDGEARHRAHKSPHPSDAMNGGTAKSANNTSRHQADAQAPLDPMHRHSATPPPNRPMRPRGPRPPALPRPLAPRTMGAGTDSGVHMAPPAAAKTQAPKARALLSQANRHLSKRLFGAARQAFAEAAKIPGFRGAGLTGLARVAFEQRQWAAAVRAARRAVAGGGGVRARMYLGNSLYKLGRYAEAARVYRAVLARQPGHAGAQRLLTLARKRLGQN
jgi:serine/threonine protein kinase